MVEGYKKVGSSSGSIDELLTDAESLSILRRFRNGVFHFQGRYLDDRFIEFAEKVEAVLPWTERLHAAFSKWFMEWFAEVAPDLIEEVRHDVAQALRSSSHADHGVGPPDSLPTEPR